MFVGLCKDGQMSSDHFVHYLRHADHLILIVEYWHAQYARCTISGLLVDDFIEPRVLYINTASSKIRL